MATYTKDLFVDGVYGDFILNGDVRTIQDLPLIKHIASERIKTNFNDFRLLPNIGADIDRFIGKPIDSKMIADIKLSIIVALTYDNFLVKNEIEVLHYRLDEYSIYFRTVLTIQNKELIIENTFKSELVHD